MKYFKITKDSDYKIVYSKGKSFSDYNLVLFVLDKKTEFSRIGIATAKKISKAVNRNKVKRKMREIVNNYDIVKDGYDVIILCRVNAQKSSYKQLEKSYRKLLEKSKLLKNNLGESN